MALVLLMLSGSPLRSASVRPMSNASPPSVYQMTTQASCHWVGDSQVNRVGMPVGAGFGLP